jgi:hypothetical protein
MPFFVRLTLSLTVVCAASCADVPAAAEGEVEGHEQELTRSAPWQRLANGMIETDAGLPSISRVAIDPSLPPLVYAGAETGLFVSHGFGQWWSVAADLQVSESVHPGTVVADPTRAAAAYAALNRSPLSSSDPPSAGTLFATVNGGGRWKPVLTTAGESITSVAVTSASPSSIWVSSFGHGGWSLRKSVDRGATWSAVHTEWPCCEQLIAVADQHVIGLTYFGSYRTRPPTA